MANNRSIRIAILADAGRARATMNAVGRDAERMGDRIRRSDDGTVDRLGKKLGILGNRARGAVTALAKFGSLTAATASLIGPLTTITLGMVKAGQATATWLGSLGPLIAMLPALVGALALIKLTLSGMGEAMAQSFAPLTSELKKAQAEAAKLATIGLRPLAQEFTRANFPAIRKAMNDIALSTNAATVYVMEWVNSAKGVKFINSVSSGTAGMFKQIASAASEVAVSFGELSNRAGVKDRLIALGKAISDLMIAFANWLDGIKASDVDQAFTNIGNAAQSFKDKFVMVKDVINWMAQNQGKIKLFSDALAVAAIALGLFAGGPIMGIAIGALTLLANHWTQVKDAVATAGPAISAAFNTFVNHPAVQALRTQVVASLKEIWTALREAAAVIAPIVMPALKQLGDTIMTDVVPALTNLIKFMTPVVTWFIKTFAPIIGGALSATITMISGALKMISGVINLFIALMTGDWRGAWEAVKQIVRGAFTFISGMIRAQLNAIRAIITIALGLIRANFTILWNIITSLTSSAWRAITSAISTGVTRAIAFVKSMPRAIIGVFSGAGRWLVDAGVQIVNGLINGIRSMAGRAADAARSMASNAVSAVRGALRIGSPSKVMHQIGGWTVRGFIGGLKSKYNAARASLRGFASDLTRDAETRLNPPDFTIGTPTAGGKASPTQIQLRFALTGDPLIDAIIEQLRKHVAGNGGDVQIVLGP